MPQTGKSAGEKGPSPLGRLVLVVEDEPSQLEFFAVTLEGEGYRVLRADGGASALGLGEVLEDVDLVLTDIVMPDMSGVDLVDRLRERIPRVFSVLYISGYATENDEKIYRVLPRPVSGDLLLAAVEGVLDFA